MINFEEFLQTLCSYFQYRECDIPKQFSLEL